MWKWRDWVIDAFNRNMPFDRFGIEQLAGDLLPNATVEQKLASGFNRNHMINYEGGAIPEEYQVEYVADRVDTTSNVFMGLTVGCARCHDHKFDPISQKDYYRFFAFFNTIAEKGLDGRSGNAAPILEMPTAEQASEVAWLQQAIAEHEAALPEKETQAAARPRGRRRGSPLCPKPPRDGLLAEYTFEDNLADSSGNHRDGTPIKGKTPFVAGRPGQSAAFNGEAHVEFPGFQAERFAVAFWMRSGALGEMTMLEGGPGFDIGVEDSHPQPDVKRGSPLYVEFQGTPLAQRRRSSSAAQWHHVALNFENGKPELLLDGKPVAHEPRSASPRAIAAGPLAIGDPHRDKPLKGDVGGLRIYDRAADAGRGRSAGAARARPLHPGAGGEQAHQGPEAAPARLLPHLRRARRTAPRLRELNELKTQLAQAEKEIVTVQVMAEMAQAARHLRSGARRLSQSRREGNARRAVDAAAPAQGRAREPPGPGRVAVQPAASADRARGGQSLLAALFRHRPGQDRGGFRLAGRCAGTARPAGLAGRGVPDATGTSRPCSA